MKLEDLKMGIKKLCSAQQLLAGHDETFENLESFISEFKKLKKITKFNGKENTVLARIERLEHSYFTCKIVEPLDFADLTVFVDYLAVQDILGPIKEAVREKKDTVSIDLKNRNKFSENELVRIKIRVGLVGFEAETERNPEKLKT